MLTYELNYNGTTLVGDDMRMLVCFIGSAA